MRLKNFAFVVVSCLGALVCRSSYADTLTLKSVAGQPVGDAYVAPYSLSLNNSSTASPMMCINYDDHVTVGESWAVTSTVLSTSSLASFQEEAWLFSLLGTSIYSNAEVQYAAWYIMDPKDVGSLNVYKNDPNMSSLVLQAALIQPLLNNSFLNKYTLYTPVLSASGTWTAGTPQSFIAADPVAVTPEPSSLLLMATGLCGTGTLLMRRRSLQKQGSLL